MLYVDASYVYRSRCIDTVGHAFVLRIYSLGFQCIDLKHPKATFFDNKANRKHWCPGR